MTSFYETEYGGLMRRIFSDGESGDLLIPEGTYCAKGPEIVFNTGGGRVYSIPKKLVGPEGIGILVGGVFPSATGKIPVGDIMLVKKCKI